MASVKCRHCGLVNWPEAEGCVRCGSPLWGAVATPPPVWKWYVAYCVLMALMYLFFMILGFVFLLVEPAGRDMQPGEAKIMGLVFAIMGLVFLVPFAAAPFLPKQPWAWIFGLVLICLGLTSACCLPASIPLLIFWLKPENKAYFGRT